MKKLLIGLSLLVLVPSLFAQRGGQGIEIRRGGGVGGAITGSFTFLSPLVVGNLTNVSLSDVLSNASFTGVITNVNEGNKLYVRTNGNDSTGTRGRLDKPYLTIAAAKTASVAGDRIIVGSGLFGPIITNGLKNLVDWEFQGTIISNSYTADVGFFDNTYEGNSGAITCNIMGNLTFIDNASCSVANIFRGSFLTESNPASQIYVKALRIVNLNGDPDPAIRHFGGALIWDIDTLDFDRGGSPLFWGEGNQDVYGSFRNIDGGSDTPFWCEGAGTGNWYISGERVDSVKSTGGGSGLIYFKPSAVQKLWLNLKEGIGASVASGYGGVLTVETGKVYLSYQKLSAIEDTATPRALVEIRSGEAWLNGQKVSVTNNQHFLSQTGGFIKWDNLEWQDTGVGSSTRPYNFIQTGGTNLLQGGQANVLLGPFYKSSGGRSVIKNMSITTAAQDTNYPVWLSGGTVIMQDVGIFAGATNSIFASSAQQVSVNGILTIDKPINSNVSINTNSTNVTVNIQLRGITVITDLPTNSILYVGAGGIISTVSFSGLTLVGGLLTSSGGDLTNHNTEAFGSITVTNSITVLGARGNESFYDTAGTEYSQLIAANNITANNVIVLWTNANNGIVVGQAAGTGSNQLQNIPLTAGQYVTYDGSTYIASNLPSFIVGPASATDNALAVFDGTTGKLIKNSVLIATNGTNLTIPGVLRAASGSLANPSIVFAADDDGTGTGLFRQGADSIGITINGTELFRFNSSLNLIGSTALNFSSIGALIAGEANNIIQQGSDSATASAQTFKGPDGLGTDKVGGDMTIGGGRSTGTGIPGKIHLTVSTNSVTSASTQNAFTNVVTVGSDTTGLTFVNRANYDITTNDFVLDTYYTNLNQRGWASCVIGMTNVLATDRAQVALYLDQNGDGTWERTGIEVRMQGVIALAGSEELCAFLQPNARFIFTNKSSGATATIVANSSQWVKE